MTPVTRKPTLDRPVWAWALYDWGNSAFATAVLAGYFPVMFKEYWAGGLSATESTWRLGITNAVASLVVVAAAPILGAIADQGSARKRFLAAFAALGVSMTACLVLVQAGQWPLAALLYLLAGIGFSGGNIFYDSLLVFVAGPDRLHRVSALGFALGYLGGGLLFAATAYVVDHPAQFGLDHAAQAVRVSFLAVALWWAVFSIPLWLVVREPGTGRRRPAAALVAAGWRQLTDTFREVRRLRPVFLFLAAYWLYIDGVDTIVRMAVDYGLAIGFLATDLIKALLLTQFVGFPAAIAFGRLGERLGARTGIYIALACYASATVWAGLMSARWEFYAIAVLIGLVQGGIQALSRSLYAQLIPTTRAAEFYGFYNMVGKFAAVLGPLMVGGVGVLSGSPRVSILSILVLFAAGAWLLGRVRLHGTEV